MESGHHSHTSHAGHHHHHHHVDEIKSLNAVFIISIILNLLFVGVEALVGVLGNSLSLLGDAGHNLSDVFSLLLVLVAFKLSKLHGTKRFTYGYKKSTVLISLLNAIILLVAVGGIVIEAIHKLAHPAVVDGSAVSWTAGVGIVINGLTALLLMKGQKEDLNIRGAFLHMLADTLVSVGVVLSGIVMLYTDFYWIDSVVSLLIAAVILFSTWGLLTESLSLSMDAMPSNIDLDCLDKLTLEVPHVVDVHHIHVWAISTTENALTAHLVIDELAAMDEVKYRAKRLLAEHGIAHSTLEFETCEHRCEADCCDCC